MRKGDVLVVLEAMKLEVGIALFSSPLNCPPACLAAYTLYLPPRPFGRHHTAAPAAGGCNLLVALNVLQRMHHVLICLA